MTEKDVIFKTYGNDDNLDPNCFCHFGWEAIGEFAFWKYARAYYECAEILFERFKPQIRNYAPNMIQKRKESASLVKRGHSASNVTIKAYKCP